MTKIRATRTNNTLTKQQQLTNKKSRARQTSIQTHEIYYAMKFKNLSALLCNLMQIFSGFFVVVLYGVLWLNFVLSSLVAKSSFFCVASAGSAVLIFYLLLLFLL